MINFKRVIGVVASAAIVGLGSSFAFTAAAESPSPTFGSIPEEAHQADGSLNSSLVPDFILAVDRNGEPVGYVSKDTLNPGPARNEAVYASDGKTVVGQMVPGYGFVRNGSSTSEMRPFEVTVGAGK